MDKSLRHYLGLFLLGFVVGCLIVIGRAQAETGKPIVKENEKQPPRFSLHDSQTESDFSLIEIKENYKPLNFTWQAITANSPASGSVPIVGPGSQRPYYDFSDGDGRGYPFYIVK